MRLSGKRRTEEFVNPSSHVNVVFQRIWNSCIKAYSMWVQECTYVPVYSEQY